MQRTDTPRRRASNLLENSLAGVQVWMKSEWAKRVESPLLSTVMDLTLDGQRALAQAEGVSIPSGKLPIPNAVFALASLQQSQSGPYNPWAAYQFGFLSGYSNGKENVVLDNLRPVDVGLGVRFSSNNFEEALLFATMIMELQPNVRIVAKNNSTGMRYAINLDLGGEISFPNADISIPGEPFRVETTIVCRTFVGYSQLLGTIKSIQINLVEDFLRATSLETVEITAGKRIKKLPTEAPSPLGGNRPYNNARIRRTPRWPY